jgi:L-lactate dehydrogenase
MSKANGAKIAIIGCGKVGMTAAYSILHSGVAREILLVGRTLDSITGEELDLEHGMSFLHPAKVSSTIDYADLADSDVVIYTAGAAQEPGESRLALADKNIKILSGILPNIIKYAPDSILLLVTNPVDILTYKAYVQAEWPKGRVIGSGTTLDTARFRFHLSESLKIDPRSIHAYVLGEHGDHSFPALKSAAVGGQPLLTLPEMNNDKAIKAFEKARTAAYKIIQAKGATFYAIGTAVSHIVSAIVTDSRKVLPLSVPLHQYYGHSGVALSMPCVVGRAGVHEVLHPELSSQEQRQLAECVSELKKYL